MSSMLFEGSQGAEVEQLQHLLAAAGYSPGTPDGIFGAGTHQAVVSFQHAHGLGADGVVGPQTWHALQGGGAAPATHDAHAGQAAHGAHAAGGHDAQQGYHDPNAQHGYDDPAAQAAPTHHQDQGLSGLAPEDPGLASAAPPPDPGLSAAAPSMQIEVDGSVRDNVAYVTVTNLGDHIIAANSLYLYVTADGQPAANDYVAQDIAGKQTYVHPGVPLGALHPGDHTLAIAAIGAADGSQQHASAIFTTA